MALRTRVAAAASPWVAALLDGPQREARVLGHGRYAVYVDVGGEALALLGAGAIAVPVGLRTALEQLPDIGRAAHVGGGVARFGEVDVTVTRLVSVTVAPLDPAVAEADGPVLDPVMDEAVEAASRELDPTALAALAAGSAEAVEPMLGCGTGLTPTGDDVLCGWLVTGHAMGRDTSEVADAVRDRAPGRTSTLSATLLRRACHGEAIPPLHDALSALGGPEAGHALAGLLAVGHTSGPALALGIRLALS